MTINLLIMYGGATLASFLMCILGRYISKKWSVRDSLMKPSSCDFCQRRLSFLSYLPLIGWFANLGRTTCCNRKLSRSYPIVEFMTGVLLLCLVLNISLL